MHLYLCPQNNANMKTGDFTSHGLYKFDENAVYILKSIKLSSEKVKDHASARAGSILQYQHGVNKQVNSINELELEAYKLEDLYIQKQSLSSLNRKYSNKQDSLVMRKDPLA